jgi:DNA-binding CsgD family transcriptional regulator
LTELPQEAGLSDSLKFIYAQKANALVDSIEKVDDIIRLVEISNQAEHSSQSKLFNWIIFGLSSVIIGILLIIFYKIKHQTITQQENHTLTQQNQTHIQHIQEKLIASIQNFTSTPQYQKMRKVLSHNDAHFSYKELEELQKETLLHFRPYIKLLQPILSLSDKDAYLCCLFALKLSIKECAICRNVSPETIRSQKARIKKRIPQEWLDLEIYNILF